MLFKGFKINFYSDYVSENSDFLASSFKQSSIIFQIKRNKENGLKDPNMLKRFNDIEKMAPAEKDHVLFAINALIQKIKLTNIAAL
jgi:hypothetical protein